MMNRTAHDWDLYLRGCDDLQTIRCEMEDQAYEARDRDMDAMEARGVSFLDAFSDEIPF